MVSISNALTLALIGGGILAFYKLGGAGGIGSRIGGGFSTLFDSFSSSLNLSSIFPKVEAATVDNNYQTWLDSYGTGDGVLDVVQKNNKYCVGGFCFDEDPNLAATPPSPIAAVDEATTVNTGGFIQSGSSGQEQSTSWDTSSFQGVNITGSYTSQSIPNYSSTTLDHSQNNNSGGSGGNSTGGSSGGNSGGGGSSSSSSGGSSSGGSSSGGGSSSSSSGGSSSSSSGGSSGGQTGGTSSKGGQGAGRSSNRGR